MRRCEDANQEYLKDGVRLLELSKKAYFLFKKQKPHEKRRLLNFVCSNSTWKDRTLTATFRQPFDILAVTNTAWQSGRRRSHLRRPPTRPYVRFRIRRFKKSAGDGAVDPAATRVHND